MALIKRGGKYSVRYVVPKRYHDLIGGSKQRWKTTGTGDLQKAKELEPRIVANIIADVKRKARLAKSSPSRQHELYAFAQELVEMVARGDLPEGVDERGDEVRPEDTAMEILSDRFDEFFKKYAENDYEDVPESELQIAKNASRMVSSDFMPLQVAIDRHLTEADGRVNASTLGRKQAVLEGFCKWAGNPDLSDVKRRTAGAWVSERLAPLNLAPGTKKWNIGALSAFFNWAIRKGLYEAANPMTGMAEDIKGSKRGNANGNKRRPWTPEEIAKVDTCDHTDNMYFAMRIALYSGMRLNEITHTELKDVSLEDGYIALPKDKKNLNSVRQVPLHADIKELVAGLVESSTDGFLLTGLKPGGKDKTRGWALSKRIGRWIRTNVSEDKGVVFHSLRNTFMHACENAGIPESTTKLIVGHARQSLTYGLYSPGVELETLREAVNSIKYK